MTSKKLKSGGPLAKLAYLYRASRSTTDESIHSFFSSLNCPMSLSCWLLYKNGEHQQLLDREVNPSDYLDVFAFRDAYAAAKFLSKSNFLKLDLDRKEVALKKFFEFEALCGETNRRFLKPHLDPLSNKVNESLLFAMKRKIDGLLLGFSADEWFDSGNWGPGVTTLLKGSAVSAYNKFHSESGITRDLYSLVGEIFPVAYPRWYETRLEKLRQEELQQSDSGLNITCKNQDHWVTRQIGNDIITVPKNAKTDRVIAVEPGLNLWFQKGIGCMIRKRLRRVGIDLTDQGRNGRLAKRASRDDSLATVDFSSASDSISTELVRAALPGEWFEILDACRSKLGTRTNSTPLRWNKFSSMGNGFTFELESLLFYAAACAVCDHLGLATVDVSVYGDDVILPKGAYDLFASFSTFLGFRVNSRKSFASGPFRESCGAYFFEAVDVKPIFLEERITNVQAVYKLANSVRNFAHRRNSYYGCDARFHHCWRSIHGRVPKALRFGISRELGEAGFAVNFDEASPSCARAGYRHRGRLEFVGFEGFYTSGLLEIGVTRSSEHPAMLLCRLKVPSTLAYENSYAMRGQTRLRVDHRLLVSQWYNFGPWF